MAVDKLVDSAQLNADLTSIANAIRTKGGASAQLAFPAEFISAINAISGGGGGSSVEHGTFTLTANANNYTISDLVGTTKEHVLIKAQGSLHNGRNGSSRSIVMMYFEWGDHINYIDIYTNSGGTSLTSVNAAASITSSNNAYFERDLGKVTVKNSNTGYMLSGVTFDWWAW